MPERALQLRYVCGCLLRANAGAERLDAAGAGLCLRGRNPDYGVMAALPTETRRLREAAADAACGGAGGALRLTLHPDNTWLAVISPLPRSLSALAGSAQGRALLTLRPLDRAGTDNMRRLGAQLFGLTAAEADVAATWRSG